MKTKVRVLNDKVLIKIATPERETKSGIILPEASREKPKNGTVVDVGDGKMLDWGSRSAFRVKKGDQVLFAKYAGTEIKIDNEDFLVISEDEIIAILN